jgi:hypothetical protein
MTHLWRPGAAVLLVAVLAAGCTGGPQAVDDAGAVSARARLSQVSGKVLVKRSNGDDWIDAAESMDLYENDKIRTAAGGTASIAFASGGSVALGEDALIAIAETRARPGLERSDVTVLQGQVNAELPDPKRHSLSVATPSATVRAGREIVFQ